MKSLFSIFGVVVLSVSCFGQVKEAKDRLSLYEAETQFAHPSYLVVQTIESESVDDVKILSQSKAEWITFVDKKVEYGKFWADPTFLDGPPEPIATDLKDPYGKPISISRPTGPFSSTYGNFEYINLGMRKLTINQSDGDKASFSERRADLPHGTVFSPFDPMAWPIINPLHLKRWGDFAPDILKVVDGMECVSAEEQDGLLTAVWQHRRVKGHVGGYACTITFEDEKIVKSKWEMVIYEGDKRRTLSIVKTKWGEKRGDAIPVEVSALIEGGHPDLGNILVTAKLNWFFPEDKEYEEAKKSITPMVEHIQKNMPERKIAGAE